MMHIYVSIIQVIPRLDNGLSPDRHHAIISTYVGKLLTEHPRTNLSEIQIRILASFSFKKMRMKMTSAKLRRMQASVNSNTLLVYIIACAQ